MMTGPRLSELPFSNVYTKKARPRDKRQGRKREPDPGECGLCGKFLRWRVAGFCYGCRRHRRGELEAAGHMSRSVRLPKEPVQIAQPSEPTDSQPGSEEKIAVMQARYARGEGIFHPGDRSNRPGRRRR
jgi:hypothetical protein